MSTGQNEQRFSAGQTVHATMQQVATLAGVGVKSVSRVVNDEPNVSADLRARVERAIRSLNYQPNMQAGNLRRGDRRSHSIGLVVSSVANQFASTLHRGVEDAALRRHTAVFSSSGDEDPDREREIIAALVRRRVDGLIVTSAAANHGYLMSDIARGTPLVFVDRAPVGLAADAVVSDNVQGATGAVRHLLDRGHRRIAYLGDRDDIRTAAERRSGYERAMGEAGVPLSEMIVVEALHDEAAAVEAATAVLRLDHPPTAIFASQNEVTVGVIRALRALGLHHSVALVGFDDIAMADLLDPAVTVVAQDAHRIGELATERLFARLDGDDSPPAVQVVPTTFIPRGSGEIAPTGRR